MPAQIISIREHNKNLRLKFDVSEDGRDMKLVLTVGILGDKNLSRFFNKSIDPF